MADASIGEAALILKADSRQLDKGLGDAEKKVQASAGKMGENFNAAVPGLSLHKLESRFLKGLWFDVFREVKDLGKDLFKGIVDLFDGTDEGTKKWNESLKESKELLEQTLRPDRAKALEDGSKSLAGALQKVNAELRNIGASGEAEKAQRQFAATFGSAIPDHVQTSISALRDLEKQLEAVKLKAEFRKFGEELIQRPGQANLTPDERKLREFEKGGIHPDVVQKTREELEKTNRIIGQNAQFTKQQKDADAALNELLVKRNNLGKDELQIAIEKVQRGFGDVGRADQLAREIRAFEEQKKADEEIKHLKLPGQAPIAGLAVRGSREAADILLRGQTFGQDALKEQFAAAKAQRARQIELQNQLVELNRKLLEKPPILVEPR